MHRRTIQVSSSADPRDERRGSARRIGAAVAVVAVVAVLTALSLGALGKTDGVPTASGGIANAGSPTPTVAPSIGPGPGSPAPSGPSTPPGPVVVRVDSIPALLRQLADNQVDEIVVADGTYHVSEASEVAADSLWIDARFAGRTNPVLVRAETPGGVTFDGSGGGTGYGGLNFEDGAHDQTWDGFNFANMEADRTGIVSIAGYTPRRAPHHITLRNITIERSCTGSAHSASSPALDHAFYVANALAPGPHDLLFENITVDGRGGLASAFQFFHSTRAAPNASNLVVRGLRVTGTQQGLILWDPTLHDITFDDVVINGALAYGVRYETVGSTDILLSNVTSRRSGFAGFRSSQGSHPPGVTFENVSLR
jgi:hypothetical protein